MYISSNQTSRLVNTMHIDCGSLSGRNIYQYQTNIKTGIAMKNHYFIINTVTEFVKHRPTQIDGRL